MREKIRWQGWPDEMEWAPLGYIFEVIDPVLSPQERLRIRKGVEFRIDRQVKRYVTEAVVR